MRGVVTAKALPYIELEKYAAYCTYTTCALNITMFEDTFKSFKINVNALNGDFFVCGDIISGRIIFELSKEITVNAIDLILKGNANAEWSTGSGKNRRYYSASEDYFQIKCDIQRDAISGNTVLRKGTHVYPFRVQLPRGNFPSSFHGLYGRVEYALFVEIHRPRHSAEEFTSELNFVRHIDATHPELLAPLFASKSKELCCLCCASGPISMYVRLERRGYAPGEMIQIIAEFENASSRVLVPKATLVQKQTYYDDSTRTSTSIPVELAEIEGRRIMPYMSEAWGDQMLRIPADTPLTVSDCQVLEVDYLLLVSLKIPYGINLKVVLPLVICSSPVCRPPA